MIGIIGALPEEIKYFRNRLSNQRKKHHGITTVYIGYLAEKEIVLAESTVGMVAAAKVATLFIETYKVNLILFVGVGGALIKDLHIGDIVIGKAVTNYDINVTYFDPTLQIGQFPFSRILHFYCNPSLIHIALKSGKKILADNEKKNTTKICLGYIATGSEFLSPTRKKELTPIWDSLNTVIVDLEGAGVGQVCFQYRIPFLVIRGVSDTFTGNTQEEFLISLPSVNKKLGQLVEQIIFDISFKDFKEKKKNDDENSKSCEFM